MSSIPSSSGNTTGRPLTAPHRRRVAVFTRYRRTVATLRFTVCLIILIRVLSGAALDAQEPAPGGFTDSATSAGLRPFISPAEARAFLPQRGRFTFPSPYNTTGFRLTNADDCGGRTASCRSATRTGTTSTTTPAATRCWSSSASSAARAAAARRCSASTRTPARPSNLRPLFAGQQLVLAGRPARAGTSAARGRTRST